MKRQLVLIILLIAAIGYAGYMYWPVMQGYLPELFKPQPQIQPAKVVQPEAEPGQPEAGTADQTDQPTPEVLLENKKAKLELIDPFALRINIRSRAEQPKVEKVKETEPEPELEGIWVDSGMRVAFISNQAVVQGGLVMGWRVSRITKTQVTLTKGRRKKILKLEAIQ
jgi:hypothetical protein